MRAIFPDLILWPRNFSQVHTLSGRSFDLDFAGQALAGFDYEICPHFSHFTEYKFIDAPGTDRKSGNLPGAVGGGTYRFKPDQIQQHLITAGLKDSF